MTTNAESSEKVLSHLKRVVRDSEEPLHDSGAALGERAREVRERLATTLEKARVTCRRLQEKTSQAAKATDNAIRTYPYQSMGIALGTGLLLGILIGRKHRKS
jgi:ElaB/YqjD/DUF883 family membrane-anchored ribosome-binding protein